MKEIFGTLLSQRKDDNKRTACQNMNGINYSFKNITKIIICQTRKHIEKIKKNNIRVTAFTNVISFDKTNLQISQN